MPNPKRMVAEISMSYLQKVDFFLVENTSIVYSSRQGMDRPFRNRPLHFAYQEMEFEPSPTAERELYIRASSEVVVHLPLHISDETTHHLRELIHVGFTSLFIGIFTGIVIYNLFVCVSLRDIVYVYYSAYQVGIFIVGGLYVGFAQQVFPYLATEFNWCLRAMAIALTLVIVFCTLFIQQFAALKQNDPMFNRLIKPTVVFCLFVIIPLCMVLPVAWTTYGVLAMTVVGGTVITFGTAWRARPAKSFISICPLSALVLVQSCTSSPSAVVFPPVLLTKR